LEHAASGDRAGADLTACTRVEQGQHPFLPGHALGKKGGQHGYRFFTFSTFR
jgi:hypothetical protein